MLGDDLAMPFALGNEGLRIIGVADENNHGNKMRGTRVMVGERREQFSLLRVSDFGSPA